MRASPRFALASAIALFSVVAPGTAGAVDCVKDPIECCLQGGGDILTCACQNGGPCEGAQLTVACGRNCATFSRIDLKAARPAPVSIDYVSGGQVIYTDNSVYPIAPSGVDGIHLIATGNSRRAEFDSVYRDKSTSILRNTDLTLKVYTFDALGRRKLMSSGPDVGFGRALWAEHSLDAVAVGADLAAEVTRAKAAEAALGTAISDEAKLRLKGDADTLAAAKSYASSQGGIESATRANADLALQAFIETEASRAQSAEALLALQIKNAGNGGDVTAVKNALDAEIAERKLRDADTLAAAKVYTDAETAARIAAVAKLTADLAAASAAGAKTANDLTAEIAARLAADAALTNNLNAEVVRAKGAESMLGAALSQEAADRKQADAALDGQVAAVKGDLAAFRAALADAAGTPNDPKNPVDWSQLKNVPPFAPQNNSGSYVQNQTLASQNAAFHISGNGTSDGSFIAAGFIGSGAGLTNLSGANLAPGSVGNGALANASVQVIAGTGLSGGGAVALGGAVTLGNDGVLSVAAGPGITVGGGAQSPTIANAGVLRLAGGGGLSVSAATGNITLGSSAGGDLAGSLDAAAVVGLRGRPLGADVPAAGQVLGWDGGAWRPTTTGNVTGNGKADAIVKWSGVGSVTASSLVDDGATISTALALQAARITSSGSVTAGSYCIGNDCRAAWNGPGAGSVNPMPRDCPVGQVAISTGAFTWSCSVLCAAGTADCDNNPASGCEVNFTNDANNCGGCGAACSNAGMATRTCAFSLCNGACAAGFADCNNQKLLDGCEINTTTDINNCGGCGKVCATPPNASASACAAGACTVAACNAGFGNCDGLYPNGCEVNLNLDANNCGSCGKVCALANASSSCAAGACAVNQCNVNFGDCNLLANDGCESNLLTDANNCGGCGKACGLGGSCVAGACVFSKRVFVSSVTYNGNLGGLAGADTKCQGLAAAQNLGGTWKAWLSDNVVSASARLTHNNGPYVLVDGTVVASSFADLTDGTLLKAINKTEKNAAPPGSTGSCTGSNVWSNTDFQGNIKSAVATASCTGWTVAVAGQTGNQGNYPSSGNPNLWTDQCTTSTCDKVAPIYCFEQ